ncbi:MAG: sigma-70 family RNA polymerase sigma factor [Planctomycetes bacterium]|jgi:RNA polymerase primary sigma factor|nr:sigma-70 family RNA polymerase sigma factor [Planctomycetota bacterium]
MISNITEVMETPREAQNDEVAQLAKNCVYHSSFAAPASIESLYSAGEAGAGRTFTWIPEGQGSHARQAAPSADEEKDLFVKYNYARWMLNNIHTGRRFADDDEVELWRRRLLDTRSQIVQANMALVLAMVKRVRFPNVELDELVSEGSMALLRSVDKFDVSRGYRFSTYSCRSILQSFGRLIQKEAQHKRRFPVQYDTELETVDQAYTPTVDAPNRKELVRTILTENLADLTVLEQNIVKQRFAIDSPPQNRKMKTIAEQCGYSTRRVRQILKKALQKIQNAMQVCTEAA